MDPDANVEEQRALAAHLMDTSFDDGPASASWSSKAVRLADLVQALDQWLSKGGAWPKAWTP